MSDSERVPVHVITGFLGVGKTTAIRHLLEQVRPEGERWAVLVNEFGEVGIDGALLEGDPEGVAIKEVPGGCICCTGGLMFQVGLTLLVQRAQPDRVLIEPTGIAEPGALLDTITGPGLGEALEPRATITLVDPRHLEDARYTDNPTWRDQVEAADVLVASRCDRASEAQLEAFDRFARGLFPPKQRIEHIEHGRLEASWLELRADPRAARQADEARGGHLGDSRAIPVTVGLEAAAPEAIARREAQGGGVRTCGWVFEARMVFDSEALAGWLRRVRAESYAPLPAGFLRLKGVFHTERAWSAVNLGDGEAEARATSWRRDSRVELIAPAEPAPDWDAIERELRAALRERPGALGEAGALGEEDEQE